MLIFFSLLSFRISTTVECYRFHTNSFACIWTNKSERTANNYINCCVILKCKQNRWEYEWWRRSSNVGSTTYAHLWYFCEYFRSFRRVNYNDANKVIIIMSLIWKERINRMFCARQELLIFFVVNVYGIPITHKHNINHILLTEYPCNWLPHPKRSQLMHSRSYQLGQYSQ